MATNPMVNFKKGLLANLPATKTAGTFYVTTDERAMYLDVDASTRIRLGDFQEFATVDALKANTNPNTSALYYISGINCLAKWNGSEYVQINKDTGMTSVEVTGNGNAITAAVYDASGRKLTITKGATYMTAADVDSKISTAVGTLGNDTEGHAYANVKAYVDAKTSGIASDAALKALSGRVDTADGKITALENANKEGGAVANAIADAKKAGTDAQTAADNAQAAADKAQGDVNALGKKVGTIAEGKTVAGLISDAQTAADNAQAAADAAQRDVDALETKVGPVPANKNVVGMIGDVETAYKDADTALAASIKAISDDYLTSDDKTELQGNINKKVDKTTYDSKVDELASADTTLQGNIDAEKTARENADTAQVTRIVNLESKITGLSGAMHFKGVQTKLPADVSEYKSGDVIIVGEKEYVFDGTKFVEFGDVSAEGDRIKALEDTVGKAAEGETPATGLIKDIADNAAAITAEAKRAKAAEKANSDAISALSTSVSTTYETKSDSSAKLTEAKGYADNLNTAMAERVGALQTASHTHSNKALLDTYTQTEVNLADAVAKKHSHANATELDKIKDGDVAKWNAAQANAEDTAAAALSSAKSELEGKITAAQTAAEGKVTELANGAVKANADAITALQNGKADNATTLAGYGITDAYTKAETYNKDEVDAKLTWDEF